MECFRIAFWMVFLIGCLQANPVPTKEYLNIKMVDLRIIDETKVKCNENVTFIPPANTQDSQAALYCFMDGLYQANTKCDNEDILKFFEDVDYVRAQSHSSACDDVGSPVEFQVFFKELKNLVQQLESKS